jgi:hypothetical protein
MQQSREAGELRVINWKVQPDPATIRVTFDMPQKFDVEIKGETSRDESLVYPVTPSSHVAIRGEGKGKSTYYDIWNLANATQTGSTKGVRILDSHLALSPDGKYLVSGEVRQIMVLNTATGKVVRAFKCDDSVTQLAIPLAHRLVAVFGFQNKVISWNLRTGEKECELKIGAGTVDLQNTSRFSAGGRYLALLKNSAAVIRDLDSGKLAGALEVAEYRIHIKGLAFSPDGNEISLLCDEAKSPNSERISILRIADGTLVDSFALQGSVQEEYGLEKKQISLQWFPNGKRLLLHGVAVVDRDLRRVIHNFRKPNLDLATFTTRRVLDDAVVADWEGIRLRPLLVKDVDTDK